MFSIGLLGVCRPQIRPVKLFYEPFGQQSLKVSHEDDVVLAMEVDPAVVTVTRVVALSLTGRCTVENLVKRLLVDIPQHHVKVLAEGDVTVTMKRILPALPAFPEAEAPLPFSGNLSAGLFLLPW